MTDQKYPLVMRHPQHQKAENADGVALVRKTIDRFSPVTVGGQDQEDYYRGLGYIPFGEAPPMPAAFAEYPVMLYHPEAVEAVPVETHDYLDDDNKPQRMVIPAKPAVLPPVQAGSAQDEAAWGKKGYRRVGKGDPEAISRLAAGTSLDYKPAEWPKVVGGKVVQDPARPAPGPIEFPKWLRHPTNGQIEPVLVNDAGQQAVQLAAWGITLGSAPAVAAEPGLTKAGLPRKRPGRKPKVEQAEA
jgi:hypothetical protein